MKLKKAINCCDKAIEIDPKNITAINNLGKYQQEIGNEDLSITCYNKALELKPTDLRTRWLLMNTFPIVYKNFEQINYFRKNFEKNLKTIEDLVNENDVF